MTRGTARRLDYRFLGESPRRQWWAPLDDLVVLERPAVLVRGGPVGSGVVVSGIPSARRDVIGTPIRFTLVVDDPGPEVLARLVDAGLDPQGRAALGGRLDAEFPADYVDAVLAGQEPDGTIVDRLSRALAADGGDRPTALTRARPLDTSWVGAVRDPDAVGAFRQRAAQLGAGTPGWAFTTMALSSVDGVRRATERLDGPAAVLLDEGGPTGVVELGKAPAGPQAGPPPSAHRRMIFVGALTLVVLGALALAVVLLQRAPSAAEAGSAPSSSWGPAATPGPPSAALAPGVRPSSTSTSTRSGDGAGRAGSG